MWSDDKRASGFVAVVGSINQDVSARVHALPTAGETVLATSSLRGLGGKGANQAVAAAKAGARVRMIAAVGSDNDGRDLLAQLAAWGVAVDGVVVREDASTGAAFITVDGSGENIIVVDGGANGLVDPSTVRAGLGASVVPDVVLCQGEVPAASIAEAAAFASETGARFVLNLAPVVDVTARTLALADPLVVNEGEARDLVAALSLRVTEGAAVNDLARMLADEVARSVVITLGARGAVVAEAGAPVFRQPAFPSVARDTTGAGDSFVGVAAAALAAGASLAEAARRGAAAAALSVQREGAASSYATEHAIALLLDAAQIS